MHCTIMSLAHAWLIYPIGHVYAEPKLDVSMEQVQVEDFTITPPSRNDGVNQDHTEGLSMKREFTSTCTQAIIIVF
jgi:hypothetical protein